VDEEHDATHPDGSSHDAAEIDGWIYEAATQLELAPGQLRRLDEANAAEVVRRARERFVAGEPEQWWLALRLPTTSHPAPSDPDDDVRALFPVAVERCYFLPAPGAGAAPLVYELEAEALMPLLGELPFFEYYVLDLEFRWLLVETDHNEILVAPAERKLEDDLGRPVWTPLVRVAQAGGGGASALDAQVSGGTLHVGIPARDEAELRASLAAAFARLGLTIVALDEVEPLAARTAPEDWRLALGREAAWSGEIRFHTFHAAGEHAHDEDDEGDE
jgi:hypothetical protein